MPLIQITPESIRSQANTVRKYKQNQEAVITKLRRIVYTLNDSWKGEAQDAFVAKFQSMDSVYRKFSEVLEQYAALMDKAANEMQSTDQNIKSMIRNI